MYSATAEYNGLLSGKLRVLRANTSRGETFIMSKKIIAALLALAMTASLAACGNGDTSTSESGASESGTQGLSFALMAEDLKKVLDARGVKKAHILGFSDGGNLALLMGILRPDAIEALVAAGPNLVPAGAKLAAQLPCELLYPPLRLIGRKIPAAAHRADVLGLMVDQPQIPFDALYQLQLPALILGGERDMIRPGHLCHIAQALPMGRLSVLPRASHFVFREPWAEEANRRVLAFLPQVLR